MGIPTHTHVVAIHCCCSIHLMMLMVMLVGIPHLFIPHIWCGGVYHPTLLPTTGRLPTVLRLLLPHHYRAPAARTRTPTCCLLYMLRAFRLAACALYTHHTAHTTVAHRTTHCLPHAGSFPAAHYTAPVATPAAHCTSRCHAQAPHRAHCATPALHIYHHTWRVRFTILRFFSLRAPLFLVALYRSARRRARATCCHRATAPHRLPPFCRLLPTGCVLTARHAALASYKCAGLCHLCPHLPASRMVCATGNTCPLCGAATLRLAAARRRVTSR